MKILVIRLSSIGDVLLTTPLLRCLKKQVTGAEVHFLTKEGNSPLLQNNPYVDRVYTLQPSVRETLQMLKKEHYDYVADLHNNRRSRRIRIALHTKGATYRKENFHKFMFILTKRNVMSGRHVVERYFDAVRTLGVVLDDEGLECYLPPSLQDDLFLTTTIGEGGQRMSGRSGRQVHAGELVAHPYIVIACGAQHATKRIPLDKLRFLCTAIRKPIILLGDAGDAERMEDWGLHFQPHVTNLCGKTTLMQTAAFVSRAALVVTPDTGIMHLAAAFHRPTISLWGATHPDFGFSAFRTVHANFYAEQLKCHPCSRMGGRRCPHKHFRCMHEHPWSHIARHINEHLDNGKS